MEEFEEKFLEKINNLAKENGVNVYELQRILLDKVVDLLGDEDKDIIWIRYNTRACCEVIDIMQKQIAKNSKEITTQ